MAIGKKIWTEVMNEYLVVLSDAASLVTQLLPTLRYVIRHIRYVFETVTSQVSVFPLAHGDSVWLFSSLAD